MQYRRRPDASGFTLLEVLIIVTITGLMVIFGFAALDKLIVRNKLQATARETATLLRLARSEAIRRGSDVSVGLEMAESGQPGLMASGAAGRYGVVWIPEHVSLYEVLGFTGDRAVFRPDGSVEKTGAFRFEDPDVDNDGEGENQIEVEITAKASARIVIGKWHREMEDFLEHSSTFPWKWYRTGDS
jgi:type II secretory pathway pseudopilin PulG